MIKFMVIGFPRSATTWAANWLTTDKTLCIHDPLYRSLPENWDAELGGPGRGVSCTGIWRWPEWVNRHPAKKLILHRDFHEVQDSLEQLGLPTLDPRHESDLDLLSGRHVNYQDLFDPKAAQRIWDYLMWGIPWNPDRHRELVQMDIQPMFGSVGVDQDVQEDLASRLRGF